MFFQAAGHIIIHVPVDIIPANARSEQQLISSFWQLVVDD